MCITTYQLATTIHPGSPNLPSAKYKSSADAGTGHIIT
jgi:hypothetical protein